MDQQPMTEMQKRKAGLPFDVDKLYQEMDDAGLGAVIDGLREGGERRNEETPPAT